MKRRLNEDPSMWVNTISWIVYVGFFLAILAVVWSLIRDERSPQLNGEESKNRKDSNQSGPG